MDGSLLAQLAPQQMPEDNVLKGIAAQLNTQIQSSKSLWQQ
jgi:hypothetical protein